MSKSNSSTPAKRTSAKKADALAPATPKKKRAAKPAQEPAMELRRVGKKGWMQVPVGE